MSDDCPKFQQPVDLDTNYKYLWFHSRLAGYGRWANYVYGHYKSR